MPVTTICGSVVCDDVWLADVWLGGVWLAEAAVADAPQTQPGLPRVTVIGNKDAEDYRVESVDSLGPLGSLKILDAPYSIGVLSEDLLNNSMATNFKDVSKYLPLVAYQEQQGPDILRPQTRGMQGGNFQNTKIDGMQVFFTGVTSMEQFDQIEVWRRKQRSS